MLRMVGGKPFIGVIQYVGDVLLSASPSVRRAKRALARVLLNVG